MLCRSRGVHALRRGSGGATSGKWEEFVKTCKDGNEVEIDKKGLETWKTTSKEERLPFVRQVDKQNSTHGKLLRDESEIQIIQWASSEQLDNSESFPGGFA